MIYSQGVGQDEPENAERIVPKSGWQDEQGPAIRVSARPNSSVPAEASGASVPSSPRIRKTDPRERSVSKLSLSTGLTTCARLGVRVGLGPIQLGGGWGCHGNPMHYCVTMLLCNRVIVLLRRWHYCASTLGCRSGVARDVIASLRCDAIVLLRCYVIVLFCWDVGLVWHGTGVVAAF